jgi:CBS domain-containing protein
MQVREIMSAETVCCSPGTNLGEVAQMMVAQDCGEIPVCDETGKPIGVVTDRDIVCRILAKNKNPLSMTAGDCMSSPVITIQPDASIDECAELMESYQIRRVPVVERDGSCCGMVAQADLATKASPETSMDVVAAVSAPNVFASSVGGA